MKTLNRDDMRRNFLLDGFLIGLVLSLPECKQVYEPPAIKSNNNYLVVDGFINIGADTITSIRLNRTKELSDTASGFVPELHAQVAVVSSTGASYVLQDTANTGMYSSGTLSLDPSLQYRLAITTADGRKYQSDQVAGKSTPPIDSVSWKQPFDLNFYVSSHDPSGGTRYYRWDYTETWEHDASLVPAWTVQDGRIVSSDSAGQKTECWTTQDAPNILLGSSAPLAQDIIDRHPILTISNGDPKLTIKYSLLVRQYALTEEAYDYWQVIQRTSDGLGTLFDPLPTELNGNIHCLTNPAEPVIGFMIATSVQQKRLFFFHSYLYGWTANLPVYNCDTMRIPVDASDIYNYVEPDPYWAPLYFFSSSGPLMLVSRVCVDCTYLGGTTIRPSYWQ
jgi:hypothetical protein